MPSAAVTARKRSRHWSSTSTAQSTTDPGEIEDAAFAVVELVDQQKYGCSQERDLPCAPNQQRLRIHLTRAAQLVHESLWIAEMFDYTDEDLAEGLQPNRKR